MSVDGIQFGKDLKELRTFKNYSGRTLSVQVGKAPAYVSQLERGLIKNPDIKVCRKMLDILLKV